MKTVHGAESWTLANNAVTARVTREAGMVTATFRLGDEEVSPYALAPWKPDEVDPSLPPLLKFLRGDFLCLPFGPQTDGLPHGESANAAWKGIAEEESRLVIEIETADTGARVEKEVSLKEGHTALYQEFRISELEGAWSYGTHPILDFSKAVEGSVRVSVSPFRWASVYPGYFSDPENGESQSLLPSARFENLDSVSRIDQGTADLTRWPVREGNDDLVMMVNEAATEKQPFAWSAVVFDGWVWFSLKDPEDFPATLFWMSNGGRPGAPWNGTHLGRLGIEEVCSHFSDGVEVSRDEPLEDIPTVRHFHSNETVRLRMIHAVAKVPATFGKVTAIVPAGEGRVRMTDGAGDLVETEVDWEFVVHRPAD